MKILNILREEPNLCSAAFERKDFRIISFQIHDANFQKTEFNKGILTLACKFYHSQFKIDLWKKRVSDYQFSNTRRKFSEDRIQRRHFEFRP